MSSQRRELSSRNSDVSSIIQNDGSIADATAVKPKRLPPSKVVVGLAPSPNISNCKSKVNSLDNIEHSPRGGNVSLPKNETVWKANSKVGSLHNIKHKPGGGRVKIFNDTYCKKKFVSKATIQKPENSSSFECNKTKNNDSCKQKTSFSSTTTDEIKLVSKMNNVKL